MFLMVFACSYRILCFTLYPIYSLKNHNKRHVDLCLHRSIKEFQPQDLANSAWSFAALAVRTSTSRSFVKAVATAGKAMGSASFTPQGISNILWAMATLSTLDKALLEAFSITFGSKLQEWKAQELANSA